MVPGISIFRSQKETAAQEYVSGDQQMRKENKDEEIYYYRSWT